MLFEWIYGRRVTDPVEIAALVSDVWSGAHIPFSSLGGTTWIDLFQIAGYTEDGLHAERPGVPLTLYRAAEPRYVHRLAWTASVEVAQRFIDINAARYGDESRFIYTVTANPDRLLAHITDRQEDEYVTDTRGLKARRWAA
jgi:hypothetical protein